MLCCLAQQVQWRSFCMLQPVTSGCNSVDVPALAELQSVLPPPDTQFTSVSISCLHADTCNHQCRSSGHSFAETSELSRCTGGKQLSASLMWYGVEVDQGCITCSRSYSNHAFYGGRPLNAEQPLYLCSVTHSMPVLLRHAAHSCMVLPLQCKPGPWIRTLYAWSVPPSLLTLCTPSLDNSRKGCLIVDTCLSLVSHQGMALLAPASVASPMC
jgi:hypothetical protein